MTALRNYLMLVVFVGLCIPFLSVGALLAAFSDHAAKKFAQWWSGLFLFLARIICGVRLEVRGTLPNHACILAWKHQSAFETLALLRLLDHPAVVMKASLATVPIWGGIARRHGSIFVDRDRGGTALKAMLRQAKAAVAADRPVLIFPEGTRIAVGETPPLKSGLGVLYQSLGVEIVPVALDSGRVWGKGERFMRPGLVTLTVQPAVPPGLPREEAVERVHTAINRDPRA